MIFSLYEIDKRTLERIKEEKENDDEIKKADQSEELVMKKRRGRITNKKSLAKQAELTKTSHSQPHSKVDLRKQILLKPELFKSKDQSNLTLDIVHEEVEEFYQDGFANEDLFDDETEIFDENPLEMTKPDFLNELESGAKFSNLKPYYMDRAYDKVIIDNTKYTTYLKQLGIDIHAMEINNRQSSVGNSYGSNPKNTVVKKVESIDTRQTFSSINYLNSTLLNKATSDSRAHIKQSYLETKSTQPGKVVQKVESKFGCSTKISLNYFMSAYIAKSNLMAQFKDGFRLTIPARIVPRFFNTNVYYYRKGCERFVFKKE